MPHSNRPWPSILICLSLFLTVSSINCSLIKDQAKIDEELQKALKKKENYNALRSAINQHEITQGTPQASIKEQYGDPDDNFHSGSTSSNFEIWTYEKIYDKGEEPDWDNIRLFFDNNKLVSWQY